MSDHSDDEDLERFIKEYKRTHYLQAELREEREKTVTSKETDKFHMEWKEEFTSRRGRYSKEFIDSKKESDYKKCLFTIYKYHWDAVDGFQINMKEVGKIINKSAQTVDRMILCFIRCGLLSRCHNYMAGVQTYFYHKNGALFRHLFQGVSNDYVLWLNSHKGNNQAVVNNGKYKDVRYNTGTSSVMITDSDEYKDISANGITNKKRGRKKLVYTVNVELYKKIVGDFLSIYEKLNEGQDRDLQIDFGLHFNERGNYSGRSKSYFCLTLNETKSHKDDNTMEKRSDFLKRVGLDGYKEIYDIKSEVPRTTILANTGIWKSDDYDIYTEIIKESGVDEINRDVVKELYMRFNFGSGTLKQKFNYYRNSRIRVIQEDYGWTCKLCKTYGACRHHNNLKCKNHKRAVNIYYDRLENYAEYTYDEWVGLGEAIEKIQGKSWGNLVFWWTSLIEVYTIYQILEESNIRLYNVYDGFYASSGITRKRVMSEVEKSALHIYKNYIAEYF
jgi:hypothetical protein